MNDTPTPIEIIAKWFAFPRGPNPSGADKLNANGVIAALEAAGYRIVREPTEEMVKKLEPLGFTGKRYDWGAARIRDVIAAAPTYGGSKD